jgi:hypothetical protein
MCPREFRFSWRHPFFLLLFVFLTPWMLGCGAAKGKVEGTVTLDGQPLPIGNIAFHPSKGIGAGAQIQDGKYSIDKVAAGSVTVTVETETLKKEMDGLLASAGGSRSMDASAGGRMTPEKMAKMPAAAKEKMEEQEKAAQQSVERLKELQAKYRPIPAKYADPKTSGLTHEVKPGDNTIEIKLTSQ